MLDVAELRGRCRGRWLELLPAIAPTLRAACAKPGRHGPCPFHGGKDGFRLFADVSETGGGVCNTCGAFADGFAVLERATGRSFAAVLADVAEQLGGTNGNTPPAAPTRRRDLHGLVGRLWNEAFPVAGLIRPYLRARGLAGSMIPATLRWHPSLEYRDEDGKRVDEFPALVGRVDGPGGELVGVHRIYLDPGAPRKAAVPSPKKLLAVEEDVIPGAAVRLVDVVGEVLALTEGIETGLAVLEATGTPTWAAIAAGFLEEVQVPGTVRHLEIWADHDANGRGQRAAEIRAAQAHADGLEVRVLVPPTPGVDWLDVLVSDGPEALRAARRAAPPWRPPTRTAATAAEGRPAIDAGDEDLPRVAAAAWAALLGANTPPVIFRHGGAPVRIEHDDEGRPEPKLLTVDKLRFHMARAADWVRVKRQGRVPALPPESIMRDLLARPDPPLPILARVVEAPVFAPDGTLPTGPGYHAAGQTYYEPAPGFVVPPIPARPKAADVASARALLLELIGEFDFVGDAERAHALALGLLPFARAVVDGPTPLHLVEAPASGTGKTLLATVLMYPALGRPVTTLSEGRDEDEVRKRLAAVLRAAAPVVLFDNLQRRLDSPALCGALTGRVWGDRVLGVTELHGWPVTCAWIATGNNPALSDEVARRTIRIRLDARAERPWLRTGFRHPELLAWAAEHRPALVHAALMLIQAWLAAGRPEEGPRLGMFERWSGTLGGILAVAGVPGFLANLEDFYGSTDEEGARVRAFLAAWWEAYRDQAVTAAELFTLATTGEASLDLDARSEQGRKVKLGRFLARLRDRRYQLEGALVTVIQRSETRHRAVLWQLRPGESGESCESGPALPLRVSESGESKSVVEDGGGDSPNSQDSPVLAEGARRPVEVPARSFLRQRMPTDPERDDEVPF